MVWTGDSKAKLAPSLIALYEQADALHPNRPTTSDGTLGDAAHAARVSDHNPDQYSDGIFYVTGADLTDWDPRFDVDAWAEDCRRRHDPRIKYQISDGRFYSSYSTSSRKAWEWAEYTGPNGHFLHVHTSVNMDDVGLFDTSSWFTPARPDVPVIPPRVTKGDDMQIIRINDQTEKFFVVMPDGTVAINKDQAYLLGLGGMETVTMSTADYNLLTTGVRHRNLNDAPRV